MDCTKMGADSSAEITPNAPIFFCPKLSAQAQKFWISMKKRLHWVSVVRDLRYQKVVKFSNATSKLALN